MRIDGAVFDLDGTLTDSMYIWNEAPKALVRRFGGTPPGGSGGAAEGDGPAGGVRVYDKNLPPALARPNRSWMG